MIKTYSTKASDIERQWHVVDAADQVLGRMATRVARLLMGKHKPLFCRNMDVGDYVVVVNAAQVRVTGNKAKQKMYYRHSGYPGGLKTVSLEEMMQARPTRVIEHAVKGMLPRNKLNASMMRRLRVYAGDAHPHVGQLAVAPDTGEEAGEKDAG
jgi:large subunit ribosomal protein L13